MAFFFAIDPEIYRCRPTQIVAPFRNAKNAPPPPVVRGRIGQVANSSCGVVYSGRKDRGTKQQRGERAANELSLTDENVF